MCPQYIIKKKKSNIFIENKETQDRIELKWKLYKELQFLPHKKRSTILPGLFFKTSLVNYKNIPRYNLLLDH